jgi:4-hydroxyacetophenone monooxygenase
VQAIRELIETGSRAIEVREAPYLAYNERVDAAHRRMVWAHPGVGNWYKNKRGRVVMNSPWRLVDYRNMTAEFDPKEYILTSGRAEVEAA